MLLVFNSFLTILGVSVWRFIVKHHWCDVLFIFGDSVLSFVLSSREDPWDGKQAALTVIPVWFWHPISCWSEIREISGKVNEGSRISDMPLQWNLLFIPALSLHAILTFWILLVYSIEHLAYKRSWSLAIKRNTATPSHSYGNFAWESWRIFTQGRGVTPLYNLVGLPKGYGFLAAH